MGGRNLVVYFWMHTNISMFASLSNAMKLMAWHVLSSKDVDIGLSSYGPSSVRAPLLETLSPIDFSPTVMAYRKPEGTQDYGMPLGPLDSEVAAVVAGTLVLVSVLVWVLEMWSWAVSVKTEDSASCSPHPTWWTRLLLLDTVFQITGGAILAERKTFILLSKTVAISKLIYIV